MESLSPVERGKFVSNFKWGGNKPQTRRCEDETRSLTRNKKTREYIYIYIQRGGGEIAAT